MGHPKSSQRFSLRHPPKTRVPETGTRGTRPDFPVLFRSDAGFKNACHETRPVLSFHVCPILSLRRYFFVGLNGVFFEMSGSQQSVGTVINVHLRNRLLDAN